ncbi:hypothetical protein BDQ12DRAFT_691533 [Crucibulum laeve]|uniref:Uncharacterized protein n=1 Tax=Crucibulum laeve TaxID=68775 RepID=A0A5C3LJ52_9AGAR|nr:hypothetical protein BDQ12DRAFT_691533 [Crucibulum laeve]
MSTHAKTLYPTPPPTTNTLDKEQRTRLLRSTRKLGAVLGTTPFLLEPLPPVPPIPSSNSTYTLSCKTPITPRTRAYRREGRVFPSDTESSDDDDSFDNRDSYVFVPTHLPSAPYQLQSLPLLSPLPSPSSSSTPSSSRASSLDVQRKPLPIPQPRKDKGKGKATLRPLPPIHIALPSLPMDLPGSQIGVETKKRGRPLPQPLLLRLRSVPVAPNDTRAGKRDSVLSSTTTTVQAQPLSPLSPTFSVNTTTPERKRAPTDKEKRRKMAKLTRTLGENVPPELVFGTSPGLPSHPIGPRAKEHRRMRSETVTARQHGGGKTHAAVPPLPALLTPPSTTTSSPPSSATRGINRPNRPRSLTLSSIPPPRSSSLPVITTEESRVEGASSGGLKVEVHQSTLTSASGTGRTPTRPRAPSHAYSRSLGVPAMATSARNHTHAHTHMRGATVASAASADAIPMPSHLRGESIEFGRRKEREWSGEWNVRDMGDVQKRLRGLKL